jgi:hypothetical protein
MAAAKWCLPEQVVAKLREAGRLRGLGAAISRVCEKLGCAEQAFYRWRRVYGAMKEDEVIGLKRLGQENAWLKRIVAGQALDISMLKDLSRGSF